jgi:hypothetical protein
MYEPLDNQEPVCVTFTVSDWAKIIMAVGKSPLELRVKERLNSNIYDCVTHTERVLS